MARGAEPGAVASGADRRRLGGIAPGDKGRNTKILGRTPIFQGLALRSLHGATGGNDECLTGGHIPFTGCRQAGVDVGGALRDLAKLDRRPAGRSCDWSKRGQKSICRRIEMRAAYSGDRAFAWPGPRADRLSLVGAVLQQPKPLGLHADNAAPELGRAPARR